MTMVHDQDTKLVKSDNFRRASQLQVNNYLTKKSKFKNALKRVATLKLF